MTALISPSCVVMADVGQPAARLWVSDAVSRRSGGLHDRAVPDIALSQLHQIRLDERAGMGGFCQLRKAVHARPEVHEVAQCNASLRLPHRAAENCLSTLNRRDPEIQADVHRTEKGRV